MRQLLFSILAFLPVLSFGQNKEFYDAVRKIGLNDSKVMDIASTICDEYGPRLTGSLKLAKAQDWAVTELK